MIRFRQIWLFPRWKTILSLLLLSLSTIGCSGLAQFTSKGPTAQTGRSVSLFAPSTTTTTIREVVQQQSIDSVVQLKGKVNKQAPLLGQVAYELQDSTGSIWVLTSKSIPPTGAEITIRAIVRYQNILQANKNIGEFYLEEQEQLGRDEAGPKS